MQCDNVQIKWLQGKVRFQLLQAPMRLSIYAFASHVLQIRTIYYERLHIGEANSKEIKWDGLPDAIMLL
jgi:hypothetical protein